MKRCISALATAGLLAGVFGFAAPRAAQASGVIWVSQKGTPFVDGSMTSQYASSHDTDYHNYTREGTDCLHPDYNDIQLAVDNSVDNDTIYICPGLWKMSESWQSDYLDYDPAFAIGSWNPITNFLDATTGLSFVGAGANKTIIDGLRAGNRLGRGLVLESSRSGNPADFSVISIAFQNFGDEAAYGNDVTCDRAVFRNNGGPNWDGGALYADGDLETSGCLFVGNRGWSGGAVASQYNWIDYGSTFIGNRAMRGYGGAAYVDKIVQLHGTVFQQNTAALGGGALWYGAANNWIHDLGVITLDRVIATGNVAEGGSGGAVYGYDTGRDYETVVSSSVFKNNRALVDGGAIFDAEDATLTVTGSTFQQNRAGLRGIAVMGGSDGGAIMARFVSVVGNRFIGNIALDYGGAICSVNDVYTPDANVYRGNRDGAGYPNWY